MPHRGFALQPIREAKLGLFGGQRSGLWQEASLVVMMVGCVSIFRTESGLGGVFPCPFLFPRFVPLHYVATRYACRSA